MPTSPALALAAVDRAIASIEAALDTLRRERAALAGEGEAAPVRAADQIVAIDDMMAPKAAAGYARVSTDTLYRWLSEPGQTIGWRVGGQWRISRQALDAHLNGKRAVG